MNSDKKVWYDERSNRNATEIGGTIMKVYEFGLSNYDNQKLLLNLTPKQAKLISQLIDILNKADGVYDLPELYFEEKGDDKIYTINGGED